VGEGKFEARDDHLQVLLEIVDAIRVAKYSDVSEELVKKVLLWHGDPARAEGDLTREIEKLVDVAIQENRDA